MVVAALSPSQCPAVTATATLTVLTTVVARPTTLTLMGQTYVASNCPATLSITKRAACTVTMTEPNPMCPTSTGGDGDKGAPGGGDKSPGGNGGGSPSGGDKPSAGGKNDAPAGDKPSTGGKNDAPAGDKPSAGGKNDAPAGDKPSAGGKNDAPAGNKPSPGDKAAPGGNKDAPAGNKPAAGGNGSNSTAPKQTHALSSASGLQVRHGLVMIFMTAVAGVLAL